MTSPRNPSQQSDDLEPWLIAKENFWKSLSREQQRAFPLPRPETVKRDIDELQRKTNSKTRACLMKCSPFFEGVRSFDAVISPIAGLEPHGIGALVWGSVTICLNLIKEYTDVFSKIEDFLASVGDQLGRLEVYKNLYRTKTPTRFSSALVRVFEKYLAFFSHVKEFLEASKLRHFKDSLGVSRQDHNKQQLVKLSMELVKAECENAVAEAGVAEAQARASSSKAHGDVLDRVDEKLELVHGAVERVQDSSERMRRAEIFNNYLLWLKHVDVDTRLKDLLRPKESVEAGSGAATSSWIFADERFKDWITPGKTSNHILWLTGDPGVGKSTLAAYVTTEMQKWQPTGVAYFFCTYQNANTRTVVAILRSWIWQLLRKPRHLQKASAGHLALPEDEYDSTQSEDPNCDVMCDVMRQLFQQRRPTTLIVDGLDECEEPLKDTAEEEDWENFFELLKDAPEEWKILLVSRPRTWFRKALLRALDQKGLEREIVSSDNSADIETFVDQKLQSLAKSNGWDDQLTQDAARVLISHADGMFLYVSLLCKDLDNKKASKVQQALDNPPKGLRGFYERTMNGVNSQPEDLRDEFRTVLKWLVGTFRAMKLEELASALDLTPKVKDDLHWMLGSFIRIEPNTGEVLLVHASVRDYLLSPDTGLVDTAPGSEQARLITVHREILGRCLRHITADGRDFVMVDSHRLKSEQRMRDVLKHEPFLEYAAIHWVQHLVGVAKQQDRLEESKDHLDRLFLSEFSVLRWLQVFHFLFQFNFPGSNASRYLLGGVVFRPAKENTWQAFIRYHYKSFVDHLGWSDGGRFTRWDRFMHVRHGFNHYEIVARWYQSPTCFSGPLLAAFFNYTEVLKEMVNGGEDQDKRSSLDTTPLVWAATADSCSALQWLLDAGANKEIPYRHTGETPIFRAVRVPHAVNRRPGRYPAALLLHEKGAKLKVHPNDNGWLERTVLITLIEECFDSPGAAELARAILNDDPARVEDYVRRGSVLQTAAWFARPLVLKELLKDQHILSRIDDQPRGISAPLHDACSSNDPKTVQTLVQHGADLDLRSFLNWLTPLHAAVLSGGGTIPTLLDGGADPNVGELNDNTAVHLAAAYDVKVDFQLFLDKGFKIDRPNGKGRTALEIAIEHSNYAVASQLLDLGAEPEKVPTYLYQQHPTKLADERLDTLRRKYWTPCWSFELCWMLRHAKMDVSLFLSCPPSVQESQKTLKTFPVLPIPIVAKIFKQAGLYEALLTRRDEKAIVDESITIHGGSDRPYVMSQPIFGAASTPVRRLVLTVFGCCQHFGGQHAWSFYEAKTVQEATTRCVKWEPEVIFGHNGWDLEEKKKVLSDQHSADKTYLERLKKGDRVAIVQRAHFPGWTNKTEWASVFVEISVLRDQLTAREKDQIWQHNRDKKGWCVLGRCHRCAIEKHRGDEQNTKAM